MKHGLVFVIIMKVVLVYATTFKKKKIKRWKIRIWWELLQGVTHFNLLEKQDCNFRFGEKCTKVWFSNFSSIRVKHSWAPSSKSFWVRRSGVGPQMCISSKFLGRRCWDEGPSLGELLLRVANLISLFSGPPPEPSLAGTGPSPTRLCSTSRNPLWGLVLKLKPC